MKIEKIEWRNFASYGNKLQTLTFDEKSGNFFLIVGANGSGKSSLSDIIQFALYGRVNNKRLSDIPNRFNNNLEVKIVLWKNAGTKITIERGAAPGYLRLFINDEEYDQAGKKNIDSYIEEELIQMPFYVFNNIISLSINDFKSFLNMGTHDKRMIIDKIFSLDIINDVKNLIKDEIRVIKNNVYLLEKEVEIVNDQIEASDKEIVKLKESLLATKELTSGKLKAEITRLKSQSEDTRKNIDKITIKEVSINAKLNEIHNKKHSESADLKVLKKHEKLLSLDKCPTCEQSFENEGIKTLLDSTIEKQRASKDYIIKLDAAILNIDETKNKIFSLKVKAERSEANITFAINAARTKERSLNETSETPKEIAYIEKVIKKSSEKLIIKKKAKDTNANKHNFFSVIETMFSDKGIKQLALQKIIPSLNIEIANTLTKMHLEYRVVFDTEFNPIIRHLGYEVSQQQLSTGERKKIDFAILIALLRLIKLKNPGLNLFFLDEIFASLDADAVHHVLEILSDTAKELALKIFVINHTILPSELFDFKIDIAKVNNFSEISITEIT
jgi:DNA repair exonuclease SbcCD ATPase subunit